MCCLESLVYSTYNVSTRLKTYMYLTIVQVQTDYLGDAGRLLLKKATEYGFLIHKGWYVFFTIPQVGNRKSGNLT